MKELRFDYYRIKQLLQSKNSNIADLAKTINISPTTLYRYLECKNPGVNTTRKIAEALGCDNIGVVLTSDPMKWKVKRVRRGKKKELTNHAEYGEQEISGTE